jgi:bifunctional oligoribonuclease and PAP phosphatase NrnA
MVENNLNQVLKNIYDLILVSEKIIITTHVNPDGDAIGAALALNYFLNEIEKDSTVIIFNDVPYNLRFLKGIDEIGIYNKDIHDEIIKNADLIVIADLNDCTRLRDMQYPILASNAKKVVIDHHIDPKEFADIYAIDTDACSTGELIWKLIKVHESYKISQRVAECLYLAIMTDTGSFRFPRTDALVHAIISELIDCGADPVMLYEEVYNKVPFSSMKLLGEAYAGMELYSGGKFCLMTIPKDLFAKTDSKEDDIENFVESILRIDGVKVGVLITELPDRSEYRVSFRSKENYNIRDIAYQIGGGGHFNAAGARVYNTTLKDVKMEVIEKIEKMIANT